MASVRPSDQLLIVPVSLSLLTDHVSTLPSQEMKQSTFANLPAELLFTTFEHLDSEDLINIAQASRRLNLLTLPVVMERTGFSEPQKIYVAKLGRKGHSDELTPLVINTSLTSMDKFYCVLSDKRHWHDHDTPDSQISDFTRNIHRVNLLISRLSSIRSVTLVIASWGSPWFFGRGVGQPFTDAVLDLMKASIQKSCVAFQILHSHPATHPASMRTPYKFELVNGVRVRKLGRSLTKKLFPSFDGGDLQGDGWKYRKLRKPNAVPQLISSIPVHSNLTKFDISCDFLLVPPFSTWTFRVMKSSPLSQLTLSVPYFVTQEEFQHYLLPQIIASVPNLQEIRLAFFRSYILTSIVEKLPLFRFLRTVTFALLAFTNSFSATPVKAMMGTGLPHLISFTGSAHQAAYLFQHLDPYPSLRFVNIIIDYSDTSSPRYGVLAKNFATLDASFSNRNLAPRISVCLVNYGRRPHTWTSNGTPREHFSKPFKSVSRLTLDLPRFSIETSDEFYKQIDSAIGWIDMFGGLKYLTLILVDDDAVSLGTRREEIIAAVNAEFPDIEISINVVDLNTASDNRSHYHWSNARDSWVRWTREIPTMPFFLPPTPDSYICSHF